MSNKEIKIKPVTVRSENRNYPRIVTIISASKCARIKTEEIEMVEQEGRLLHIYAAGKEYSIYESIETLAHMLNPDNFFRPMRGMIINFDRTSEITCEHISFESGRTITLGRNNMSITKSAFRNFLMEYPPFVSTGEGLKVAEEYI